MMNQTQNKQNKEEQKDDMLKHLIFRWATILNEINDTEFAKDKTEISNKVRKEMLKTLTKLGYFDK